ncbi:hypothetical protein JYK14_00580 [Siccirubricoccus sp. KC 17139]|uniref:DUF2336 domain-containing protein n=1 Tax=Siccirubricoccus soli TaxID=2899147 RepID=A0ABT1D0W3_9PROT|nr:hypothetical protein [Siccirubricoccus soli]MCO6414675.1 hypothetical protein [Siccirubricoccus soli]MCP2680805.1 hypothetical protein [Siccirubricoccus soli]
MSSSPPLACTLPQLRRLAQAASEAEDAALAQIVAVLDQLDRRGEADMVLEKVRPRLRALGVPRRLNLARLLFLPMDGAIRSPKEWRRGEAALPRSALPVLAEILLLRLEPGAAQAVQALEGRSTAELEAIARLGAVLWPAAAAALPPQPPPEWAESGLGPADYHAIAALCTPIWQAGSAIWAAVAAGPLGPPDALARAALLAVAPAGPPALSIVLVTLMGAAAFPGAVAHLAALLNPQARAVAVQALDAMLAAAPPPFAQLGVERATDAALALARRLDNLQSCSLLGSDRLRRLEGARREAEEACRERYLVGAEQEVVAPTQRLLAAEAVCDEDVAAVEAAARALRGLEGAGRKLGGGPLLDRCVKELVGRLTLLGRGTSRPGGLSVVDIVRNIEILSGPQAAAAALAAMRKG